MSTIAPVSAPDQITQALKAASRRTGTEFDYLLQTAKRESGLNAAAKASTSSATGLFQFIEGTWMETLKASGAKYGLGDVAAAIQKSPSGRYDVPDPKARAAILALRTNPVAAALMAGELTQANAQKLQARLGREPTQGELYIAHFLGAGGGGQLISAAINRPNDIASQQFPAAAKANPSIFYTSGGKARTFAQVYSNLVAYHRQSEASGALATNPIASSGPVDLTPDRARAGLAPRPAGDTAVRQGFEQSSPMPSATAFAAADRPFYNLFLPQQSSLIPSAQSTKPQALVATLKAYGMNTVANDANAAVTPSGDGGRPLWGGGLFTNAQTKPGEMQRGLFAVPAGYAK